MEALISSGSTLEAQDKVKIMEVCTRTAGYIGSTLVVPAQSSLSTLLDLRMQEFLSEARAHAQQGVE